MTFLETWTTFWSQRRAVTVILYGLGFTGIGIICLSCSVPDKNLLADAVLWAFTGIVVGAFFGVLFGLPRIQQGAGGGSTQYRQVVNGALEQISEWLTKIIVGVGLVELKGLPAWLRGVAAPLRRALASTGDGAEPLALGTVVYFPIVGFLTFYLLTRLFLARALADAEANLP